MPKAKPQPRVRTLTIQERAKLLKSLPAGTERIQVVDANGATRWRKLGEVEAFDQFVFKPNGDPVTMQGCPGRKAKTKLEPLNDELAEVMEARQEHMADDPLLTETKDNPEGDAVLDNVIMAMAREASAIEFERLEAERHGRDTSSHSAKRARVLKGMADVWLKRREKVDSRDLDLDGPAFEVVFKFILETFRAAMEEAGMRQEHIETVFTRIGDALAQGWKEEAKARIRETA